MTPSGRSGPSADGLVVSNHGGRQLNFAPAALDALPAIARRVGGRAQVLLDGGVRRGSDVVKALCLGADAVCVGRPYLYGLAAAGPAGAGHIVEIFRAEIARCMTLMGVAKIEDLDESWLLPAGTVVADSGATATERAKEGRGDHIACWPGPGSTASIRPSARRPPRSSLSGAGRPGPADDRQGSRRAIPP